MKKSKINNPFSNLALDLEEQALEQAFAQGEYREEPHLAKTKVMLADAATRYLELNSCNYAEGEKSFTV